MKQFITLLIVLLSFSACRKEMVNTGTIEPPLEKIISIDTLTNGELYGLVIGEPNTTTYAKLQAIKSFQYPNYLGIVGNVFTSLDKVKNKIPLYLSLYLDEEPGTNTGIQIYFSENKVKSILTMGGIQLNEWPSSITSTVSIAVNDPIESIYPKLEAIKEITAYAKKFQRISIFEKDLKKSYDVNMSASLQWNFSFLTDQESGTRLTLNFQNQKLISIYSTLFEM